MPKNTRRVSVTRTVTFTTFIDTPGRPEETDANMLTLLGGAAGTTGTLAIGELLSGSTLANSGTITRGNWSVTGTSSNIEPYITRPQNTALTVGTRVASIKPPATYEAALGKLYVVTVAGTTQNVATEPNWGTTDGGTTSDGTVTFRCIPKFPTLTNWAASTARAVGVITRPSATSMREFLVTTAGTTAASAPTWTNADTAGATLVDGTVTYTSLVNFLTYAFLTQYELGATVKPSAASTEEYLCTTAGASDTTALNSGSPAVNASVTRGTATFKRIV
jgi:hypothetical protein